MLSWHASCNIIAVGARATRNTVPVGRGGATASNMFKYYFREDEHVTFPQSLEELAEVNV